MPISPGIRDRFEMPDGIYLLSHSVGCLPRATRNALEASWLAPWSAKGSEGWGDWLGAVDRWRSTVGRLIGARDADICPQTNLSSGLSKILGGLPQREGRRRIVLCEEDFPTVGFVGGAAAKLGYELDFLPRGAAATDLDIWADRLDGAQAALITHAFSNRSARLPVREIADLARDRGVFSIVDAVQTTGVVPYTVEELSADFVLGTSVKFLCGGSGAGFLWASAVAAALCEPIDTGWFSHEDPFEFDIRRYKLADGARRFWGGTPSIAPYVASTTGIEEILNVGVSEVHAHNQDLIDHLHRGLPEGAILSERDRSCRGNAVLIRVREIDAALSASKAAGLHLDMRDGALRLSPHLYNTNDEMDRVIEAVTPLL